MPNASREYPNKTSLKPIGKKEFPQTSIIINTNKDRVVAINFENGSVKLVLKIINFQVMAIKK